MTCKIPLTQGFETLVDDEDFEFLSMFKWCVLRSGTERNPLWYAVTNIPAIPPFPRRTAVRMHRFIMGVLPEQQLDHRNRDGLDNRKENLRLATRGQNRVNSRPHGYSSKYRGVTKDTRWNTWKARVAKDGVVVFSQNYPTEVEAAIAYDKAALEIHGEFAYTNFKETR